MTKHFDGERQRLDVFVAEMLAISRSAAKKLIEEGDIKVNDVVALKCGYELRRGDKVEGEAKPPVPLDVKAENIPLDIVYQDEWLAVIDKPQGMVVHPATSYTKSDTLVNALLFNLDSLSSINGVIRPGIVHRLDKDTSGLIVVAKNDEAHRSLAAQIACKSAKRMYIGLCDGVLSKHSGVIDAPIARCKWDRKRMAIDPAGRKAVTRFTVVDTFRQYSLVRFDLETGRTHQIRVHAASMKHPIVGDKVYGGSCALYDGGQLLHAAMLSFKHPATGEEMTFTAPLPKYFQEVLKKLRQR